MRGLKENNNIPDFLYVLLYIIFFIFTSKTSRLPAFFYIDFSKLNFFQHGTNQKAIVNGSKLIRYSYPANVLMFAL